MPRQETQPNPTNDVIWTKVISFESIPSILHILSARREEKANDSTCRCKTCQKGLAGLVTRYTETPRPKEDSDVQSNRTDEEATDPPPHTNDGLYQ